MMRRLILAITVVATAASAADVSHAQTIDTYRVVGQGDSILSRVDVAGLLTSTDRWFNTEPGREVDNPGVRGEASHMTMWPQVIAHSRPGGYIVFQDDGTRVTEQRWQEFLDYLVDTAPDDRCLVGVLPYYNPELHPANSPYVARHRDMMAATFQQQPCHVLIDWDQAAAAHPEFLEDGVHPNPAGQQFLASLIDATVGGRIPS